MAVDTDHHLIITHEVTNSGSDRAQLANIASRAKEVLGIGKLEAVADRGYYSGEEIVACDEAGIVATLHFALSALNHWTNGDRESGSSAKNEKFPVNFPGSNCAAYNGGRQYVSLDNGLS